MKIPKQEYTAEFKELAVKRVKDGQAVGAVAKDLGLIEQTLRSCNGELHQFPEARPRAGLFHAREAHATAQSGVAAPA